MLDAAQRTMSKMGRFSARRSLQTPELLRLKAGCKVCTPPSHLCGPPSTPVQHSAPSVSWRNRNAIWGWGQGLVSRLRQEVGQGVWTRGKSAWPPLCLIPWANSWEGCGHWLQLQRALGAMSRASCVHAARHPQFLELLLSCELSGLLPSRGSLLSDPGLPPALRAGAGMVRGCGSWGAGH